MVVAASDLRRVFGLLFDEGGEVAELLEEASAEAPREDREDVVLREPRGASGAPTVRLVGSILRRAAGDGAPDIHLESPAARNLRDVSGPTGCSGRS